VNSWPENYEGSFTLKQPVVRSGIGLHSGQKSKVRLSPSELAGFHVSWIDHNDSPTTLNPTQVRNSPLCTTIEIGDRRLSTVEHLLGALAGCGLTHINIEVSGYEIPILDGSAKGWVEAIKEVGFEQVNNYGSQSQKLLEPIVIHRGQSVICATPADRLKLIGMIDFPYKAIYQQMFAIELTPERFVQEIAPARTFGFVDQLEELKSAGLIKGGSVDNALVCDGDSWINPPLRYEEEPVRHKLLDLIGDLALVGLPKAQILVYRGSHALHSDLALALLKASPTN
tara:strand:- start:12219 stop:13070 length:852 start_codon:yes stop_codon:yes gene_type:complete